MPGKQLARRIRDARLLREVSGLFTAAVGVGVGAIWDSGGAAGVDLSVFVPWFFHAAIRQTPILLFLFRISIRTESVITLCFLAAPSGCHAHGSVVSLLCVRSSTDFEEGLLLAFV